MSTNVTHEECLLIPSNNPSLVFLGKITIPCAMALFIFKILLSKNIDILPFKKYLSLFYFNKENRSYYEIFINLIFIWLLCGQLSAGLATILYTKSDKHFIETITHNEVDELSIYMPRFLFDEFVSVPFRYMTWYALWNYVENKLNIETENFNHETPFCQLKFKYILVKGLSWGLNVFLSISFAAIWIAFINYTMLTNSPLIKAALWIQYLNYSCTVKFIGTLIIRLAWECIQVNLSNYILSYNFSIVKFLKENCYKSDLQQIYPVDANNYKQPLLPEGQ